MNLNDLVTECIKGHSHFNALEIEVIKQVKDNLQSVEQNIWGKTDDEIFAPFNVYIDIQKQTGMFLRPILTVDEIEKQIANTEAVINT